MPQSKFYKPSLHGTLRHSDKNNASVINRYLDFRTNAQFDYIGQW